MLEMPLHNRFDSRGASPRPSWRAAIDFKASAYFILLNGAFILTITTKSLTSNNARTPRVIASGRANDAT